MRRIRSFSLAAVLTAALAVAPSLPAAATPSEAEGSAGQACLTETQQLLDEATVLPDLDGLEVLGACNSGGVNVWGQLPDGARVEFGDPAGTEPTSPTNAQKLAASYSCDITGVYQTECYMDDWYALVNWSTGEILWQRQINLYFKLDLQQIDQQVKWRITNLDGAPMTVSGDVVLFRMQGITQPTLEDIEPYATTSLSTQAAGTEWVSRSDATEGKYSVSFGLRTVYDGPSGMEAYFMNSIPGPRFQCYAYGSNSNCEFPDGEEAGIW